MDKVKAMLAVLVLSACMAVGREALAGGGHDHGHGHHGHGEKPGPNGGEIQEVGDKDGTRAEILHDHAAGKVTLHLLGKDGKTPVAIKDAPKINLKAKTGNRQIVMTPVDPKDGESARFEATDEAFKDDPLDGRIAVTLGGKPYNVKLDAHFGHDHGHGH